MTSLSWVHERLPLTLAKPGCPCPCATEMGRHPRQSPVDAGRTALAAASIEARRRQQGSGTRISEEPRTRRSINDDGPRATCPSQNAGEATADGAADQVEGGSRRLSERLPPFALRGPRAMVKQGRLASSRFPRPSASGSSGARRSSAPSAPTTSPRQHPQRPCRRRTGDGWS